MGKPMKSKNNKVPKITEEEYTAYLASLREMGGETKKAQTAPSSGGQEKNE